MQRFHIVELLMVILFISHIFAEEAASSIPKDQLVESDKQNIPKVSLVIYQSGASDFAVVSDMRVRSQEYVSFSLISANKSVGLVPIPLDCETIAYKGELEASAENPTSTTFLHNMCSSAETYRVSQYVKGVFNVTRQLYDSIDNVRVNFLLSEVVLPEHTVFLQCSYTFCSRHQQLTGAPFPMCSTFPYKPNCEPSRAKNYTVSSLQSFYTLAETTPLLAIKGIDLRTLTDPPYPIDLPGPRYHNTHHSHEDHSHSHSMINTQLLLIIFGVALLCLTLGAILGFLIWSCRHKCMVAAKQRNEDRLRKERIAASLSGMLTPSSEACDDYLRLNRASAPRAGFQNYTPSNYTADGQKLTSQYISDILDY